MNILVSVCMGTASLMKEKQTWKHLRYHVFSNAVLALHTGIICKTRVIFMEFWQLQKYNVILNVRVFYHFPAKQGEVLDLH